MIARRPTKQRAALADALADTDEFVSAQDLHARIAAGGSKRRAGHRLSQPAGHGRRARSTSYAPTTVKRSIARAARPSTIITWSAATAWPHRRDLGAGVLRVVVGPGRRGRGFTDLSHRRDLRHLPTC